MIEDSESEVDKSKAMFAASTAGRPLKGLPDIPLTEPFNRIGICMSGGGFRAAAFSLGTLAYLNKVSFRGKPLIDHVCFISSASGGTITASCYALSKADHIQFPLFFSKVYGALKGEKLLRMALRILNDKREWSGTKQRNLINAFAKAYDAEIYNGAEFGKLIGIKDRLRICINATEFYRGLTFRFQNYGFIGNLFVSLLKNGAGITGRLKVADIMAASSCFPAGFEPMEFPGDYVHKGLPEAELRNIIDCKNYEGQQANPPVIPLMDGGITDNQGLYSAVNADLNARKDGMPPLDLFIITDVGSYFMDNYKVPRGKKGLLRMISFRTLRVIAATGGVLTLLASLYLLKLEGDSFWNYLGAFLLFPGVLMTGWFAVGFLKWTVTLFGRVVGKKDRRFGLLRTLFQLNKTFSDDMILTLKKFLSATRISVLEQMVKNRISSVVTMVMDINLKQIRRLVNEIFYDNPLFDHRRCSNYIYDYSEQNFISKRDRVMKTKRWPEPMKLLMIPSAEMQKVAESARTMGTTLWFDKTTEDEKRLEHLLACGQFTVCGSLLEYILDLESEKELWDSFSQNVKDHIGEVKKNLIADWAQFKQTPDEFGRDSQPAAAS